MECDMEKTQNKLDCIVCLNNRKDCIKACSIYSAVGSDRMHQLQNSIWCIWHLNLQSRYSANCRIGYCSMSTSLCFKVSNTDILRILRVLNLNVLILLWISEISVQTSTKKCHIPLKIKHFIYFYFPNQGWDSAMSKHWLFLCFHPLRDPTDPWWHDMGQPPDACIGSEPPNIISTQPRIPGQWQVVDSGQWGVQVNPEHGGWNAARVQ